nr:hypothetical protein [Tanacetum cinerariifolium]
MFRVGRIEVKGTMHGVQVQLVMGDLRTELGMKIQVKQGRLGATTATDLALNVDNVFQADDCDAFDSDVDESPNAQTMFMANLSFADPVYDEAGPSYYSDILSKEENKWQNERPRTCEKKVKIAPHDYSKENNLATFTPQKQLTPEQIFWSKDLLKMKEKALKEQTIASRPIKVLTLYPPNTPATLVPRVLPTKSQVKINIFALTQLFLDFKKTCRMRITPTRLIEGERGFEQTKECYLTEIIPFFKTLKDHFEGIQKALTKEIKEMKEIFKKLKVKVDQHVVHRKHDEIEFSYMYEALNAAQKCIAELESKSSNLQNKIHNDDHDVMVKHFSKLEVEHLNLQLKYQHLKESFEDKKSVTSSDAPTFDLVFVIGQLKDQVQSRGNTIRELREKVSRLTKKHSITDPSHDLKALDPSHALHDLNEHWRAKNEKVKRHYKELYDSIKIMRAKTIDKTNSLITEVPNLKAQITENHKSNCVTMPAVKPKVLAPGMYVIDVEPIPPRNRNNSEVYLDYLKHLKESVATLHEIVEEARV